MLTTARSVLVVGAGLIGKRRAQIAAAHPATHLAGACDIDGDRAQSLCDTLGGQAFHDWREGLDTLHPEIIVVSTPNHLMLPVATAAMERGADVLVEKPFGRNLGEARAMAEVARTHGRHLAIGFNHRFHPAIADAQQLARSGELGALQFVRCIYGHGGRAGYEAEWRADPEQSGGGELLDQGVHVVDLLGQILGRPCRVHAETATLEWPIQPVEDNVFATLRYPHGAVASFHASWSQWQNRFDWQVYGGDGAVELCGLGGSYGDPRLTHLRRRPSGGPPEREERRYDGPDLSFDREWDAFVTDLQAGRAGNLASALEAMEVIDALYRSAAAQVPVEL